MYAFQLTPTESQCVPLESLYLDDFISESVLTINLASAALLRVVYYCITYIDSCGCMLHFESDAKEVVHCVLLFMYECTPVYNGSQWFPSFFIPRALCRLLKISRPPLIN